MRDVRLFGFSKPRRHADDDCVTLLQKIEVGCGAQAARVHRVPYQIGYDVADVRSTGIYLRDLFLVNFESNHAKSLAGKLRGQRQSHVTKSNHSDTRAPILN